MVGVIAVPNHGWLTWFPDVDTYRMGLIPSSLLYKKLNGISQSGLFKYTTQLSGVYPKTFVLPLAKNKDINTTALLI